MIAWKYCSKCGSIISLDYYPFNRLISEELAIVEEKHSLHLCDSCINSFPTCNAKSITFGSCVGNDNVIECDSYINLDPVRDNLIGTNETTK